MMATIRKPRTLRDRLIKVVLAVIIIAWTIGATIAIMMSKRETDLILDSAMQEVAQRILPLAFADLIDPDNQKINKISAMPLVGPHQERITYVVRDGQGRIQLQSHDAVLSMFPNNPKPGYSDGPDGRLYTELGAQGSIRVTVAEMPGIRSAALWANIWALSIPLGLALIASLVLIRISVASVLEPLDKFKQAIETRDEHHLDPVEINDLPSELAVGAQAVNDLMRRLNLSLAAERLFVARAAHELRTPIAAALAQTQLLAKYASDPTLSNRIKAVENSLKRLSSLSTKLLEVAKSEGSHAFGDHPINLSAILDLVIEELASSTDKSRVHVEALEAVMSPVDADAAAIVIRNLIENALKHGDPVKPIIVRLTKEGLLSVSNEGPIISEYDRQRLARPFQRGQTAGEGTGLGLSIVSNYAKAFGSQFEILSPDPSLGTGCQMRFQFPAI